MRLQSTGLVKLAIKFLAAIDKNTSDRELVKQLDEGMKKVLVAFTTRPLGDPARIEKAAGELAVWADKLARRLNATVGDRKATLTLLAIEPELYAKELVDYDSARQAAWAYEIMFNEVNGARGGPASKRKILGELDRALKLRLPSGRKKLIEDELEESLKVRNNYNPEAFQKLFRQLKKPGKDSK
jgi:hypothetical protein